MVDDETKQLNQQIAADPVLHEQLDKAHDAAPADAGMPLDEAALDGVVGALMTSRTSKSPFG